MLIRLKTHGIKLISQTTRHIRMFEGRKSRKLRKYLEDAHIDFCNTLPAKEYVKRLKEKVKAKSEFVPFSKALNDKKIPKILPMYVELKKEQRRHLSRIFRIRASKGINIAQKKNQKSLEEKIFFLDKTAAVLENYRKILEVKIFNRLLHREREKRLFLKMHARKLENLIPNYDIRFKTFERYNNTELTLNEPQYTLHNFLEESKSIGKVNEKYQKYLEDQNTLANIRIEQFLTERPRNPKLLKLAAGNNETSIITVDNTPSSIIAQTDTDYQIELKDQLELANKIRNYENNVINYYDRHYDIYKAHKRKGRPNFLTLNKDQILNYIKFNLKSTNELFELYSEIKEREDLLTVSASLLQRLAISIDRNEMNKLIECKPFIEIFRNAGKAKSLLNDKGLIDTFFAMALIYSNIESTKIMPKYLWHFTCDYVEEIEKRIDNLNENHLAFLCKSLRKLQLVYEFLPELTDLDIKLITRTKQCIPNMKSYNIAPILEYITSNNLYQTSKDTVKGLIEKLTKNINTKSELYIYPNDLAASAIAISTLPERPEWALVCLKELKDISLNELNDFSFGNSSTLLKAYSITRQWHKDLFDKMYNHMCRIYQLQSELVKFEEYGNALWSIAKYFTHEEFAALNAELGAFMCPNTEYRLGQYKARILDFFMTYMDRFKLNVKNSHWWPKIIYVMGMLNYKNHKEITEKAAELMVNNIERTNINDWGYFLQGIMLLQCTSKDIFSTAIESISNREVAKDPCAILRCYLVLAQVGLLSELIKSKSNLSKGLNYVYQNISKLKPEQVAALLWCMMSVGELNKESVKPLLPLLNISVIRPHMCALISQALNEIPNIPRLLAEADAKAFKYERRYLDQCLENMEAKCGKNLEKELIRVLKSDPSYFSSMEFIESARVNSYLLPILSERKKLCIVFEFDNDIVMEANTCKCLV